MLSRPAAGRGPALHHALGIDRREAKALVEPVCVGGGEHEAQARELGMRQNGLDEPRPEAPAAVRLEHEHVGQPGKPGSIGHDASETGLPLVGAEQAEHERMLDRSLDDLAAHVWRPVRRAQEAPDRLAIEPGGIGRDEIPVAAQLHPEAFNPDWSDRASHAATGGLQATSSVHAQCWSGDRSEVLLEAGMRRRGAAAQGMGVCAAQQRPVIVGSPAVAAGQG